LLEFNIKWMLNLMLEAISRSRETASRLRQERLAGSRSREERSTDACCWSTFILGPFLARPMTTANEATSNLTGEVGGDAPRLIAGQQLGCRSGPGSSSK